MRKIAAFSIEKPVEKSVHIVEKTLFSTNSLFHYQHFTHRGEYLS